MQAPLSFVQAFGIALAAMDQKVQCIGSSFLAPYFYIHAFHNLTLDSYVFLNLDCGYENL